MNNRLPFLIPETDLYFRVARLLILTDTLSYSSRGNPVLTIEKLSIFEFLIKYPFILKQVLNEENKKSITVLYKEQGTIESLFPNKASLFNFTANKSLLKIMIGTQLLGIEMLKGEIFYIISHDGKHLINNIDHEAVRRIKDLSVSLLPLRSMPSNKLKKIINPLIEGV